MWNARYDRPDYLFGRDPAAFLVAQAGHIPDASRVLVVADGEGRNSVHLAGLGHEVTAFDAAPNAVDKARKLAAEKGVAVDFHEADIFAWDWAAAPVDAVVAIFIQFMGPGPRAEVFAGLDAALKPGGVLLLHGYAPRQVGYGTGGPPAEANMYELEMLRAAFPGYAVLHAADYDAEIDEGPGHSGRSGLIDFVARKPG
ncbi:methyltransferase type 11 [Dinoroseobacter shibae DFL 12 = DSM 16493]|jgi:SAM-dependent methyltransferase|uniref:Methyltransferase type 11 n=1 Tax=Dinoroseobacter shibae (strain DSM 16493 / NCIMB 14021 / DFL 12) TaxID=398580 RepID=A8LQV6_DINSH|nr:MULTISPECIES: class I SAM-dependent methyltransferase [Dinoroseobacter]ABV92499.1 methyltransferase type 11 [Dinoroseobacter shibae DFL 12 = DSM 16493]MDD9718239.1 class I SAM-dependent methyltransferase [Dinoroseobacter sp. PD6]URF47443.1 class I SAM-dependent methyltransferase [Dinoroseobacter shibae]URF51754.1 class I SAM-dependent methyltransferase [Dinoroseobacter shibae]